MPSRHRSTRAVMPTNASMPTCAGAFINLVAPRCSGGNASARAIAHAIVTPNAGASSLAIANPALPAA